MALALGRTVDELLASISSRELTEWMIYYSLEPWGGERLDLAAAIVARTIAEVNRDKKARSRPYEVKEFMPDFGPEPKQKRQSDKQIAGILSMWATALGAQAPRE